MRALITQRCRGFGLIEVLIALVVLSVGMLGIAFLFANSLRNSRSALLRTHAVNLVSDMANRIRANGAGGSAYELTRYSGSPSLQGCAGGCSAGQLAEDDLASWLATVRHLLPPALAGVASAEVEFFSGIPARYRVRVAWQEPGETVAFTHESQIVVQATP